MKAKAVFDAIIVKELEDQEVLYGSIIVPDMEKHKHILGEILDIGPGRRSLLSGELIPTTLKVGQKVLLPQIGITKIELNNEEYIACDEGKVLAIVED